MRVGRDVAERTVAICMPSVRAVAVPQMVDLVKPGRHVVSSAMRLVGQVVRLTDVERLLVVLAVVAVVADRLHAKPLASGNHRGRV